jgi:hypothetical protein
VVGNLVNYLGKLSTPKAKMSTVKALFNSVISTQNRHFVIFDLKNFYLGTPMRWSEYTRIHILTIPDSRQEYVFSQKGGAAQGRQRASWCVRMVIKVMLNFAAGFFSKMFSHISEREASLSKNVSPLMILMRKSRS